MNLLETRVRQSAEATRWWWVFLITGVFWLIVALMVFRFDLGSVATVAALIAGVLIAGGVDELGTMAVAAGGWRWAHALLGLLYIIFGILALAIPGATFVILAALLGWVLLFKGAFDLISALTTRRSGEFWWLLLAFGIVEILVAFWAAADFGRLTILVIAFTGAWALSRGLTEILFAFEVHGAHERLAAVTEAAQTGGHRHGEAPA